MSGRLRLTGVRMRFAAVAAFLVMSVVGGSVAGCGSAPPEVSGGLKLVMAEGVVRVDPPADAPVGQVVEGIAAFGYALAPADPSKNWVASPVSIAYALAMLRAGAAGDTAEEIDRVFGFPPGVHEAFNALSRQLITIDVPPGSGDRTRGAGDPAAPSVVAIGNALFPAQWLPVRDAYLQTLAEQYGAGVYPLDFDQPEQALAAIDGWASELTAGRIKKVFDRLDSGTAAALANTVYFKGEWQVAFNDKATSDEPFQRADGSTVSVATMADTREVGYAEGAGWQAVELPYGEDGAYAMRVFLPTGDLTPRDLLAPEVLGAEFASRSVSLRLPRWDFAADLDLKAELTRLGVVSAFDPGRADLSGISEAPLYVEQAVHRANITVDEFGSEAAAVTALEMRLTAIPPADVTFQADHPFAFAIVHVAAGAPLFIGQVINPASR